MVSWELAKLHVKANKQRAMKALTLGADMLQKISD